MQYDIFISYARKDNQEGRITELKEHLEQEYKAFSGKPLSCFFDKQEIKSMDDWKHRLLHGLKNSQILLIVLSPSYIESKYCEWEVVEYIKHEYARALQGEGIAQVYFVEIPGIDDESFKESIAWLKKISGRQRIDLQAWKESGMDALKREDVKERMTEFQHSLHNRISRIKRIKEAKGNLPRPNPNFIGRQAEMKKLHEALCFGTLGSYAAVHGMGGMGKTSIAFQYAYVYADFYTGGRWRMPCENQHNLNAILRGLDGHLGIFYTGEEKKDDEKAAIRILNELEKRAIKGAEGQDKEPSVLLILDNVDDAQILKSPQYDMVSGKPWLKILVTTRLGKKALGMRHPDNYITIDELPKEDALSLIESFQASSQFPNQEEENSAKEIVNLLDGFTLAIEIAATYLGEKQRAVTCADFATLLKREGSLKGIDLVANISEHDIAHEKLISLTLASTVEALSAEERSILNYAAVLPPDTIPLPWLRALAGKEYPKLLIDAPIGLEDPWLANINKLLSKRLLQMNNDKEDSSQIVKMHRLLQEVVQTSLNNKDNLYINLIDYVEHRIEILNYSWFRPVNRWEIQPIIDLTTNLVVEKNLSFTRLAIPLYEIINSTVNYNRLFELYTTFVELLENSSNKEIEKACLFFSLARIENLRGNTNKSFDLLNVSLKTITTVDPDNSTLIGQINSWIGNYYRRLGNHEECYKYQELALSYLDDTKTSDLSSIGFCYFNILECLINEIKLEEGTLVGEKMIKAYESSYSPLNPKLRLAYTTWGRLEYYKGEFLKSIKYQYKLVEILKYSLPKNHFDIGQALSHLALTEMQLGNFTKATNLYNEALNIFDSSLEPFSFEYIDLYVGLGILEEKKEDYSLAKESYLNSLTALEKNHTLNRSSGITTLLLIGELETKHGNIKEAEKYIKEAEKLILLVYNQNHPYYIRCKLGLGNIYQVLNQHRKALKEYKIAYLFNTEDSKGPDWVPNEKIKNNLIETLRQIGHTDEEIQALLKAEKFN